MKNNFKTLAMMFASVVFAFSVTSCNDKKTDPEIEPQQLDLGDGSVDYEIKSDLTLKYPNTYNLKGFVYVTEGTTLTIEPGVIIKGDKASKGTLIVERGGKIMAQGQADRPIVFTSALAPGSRKPGDWGGLIILGKAPNNIGEMTIEGGVRSKHGGNNPADNSGVLSYVRVEFAGIEYSTDNEINGITLGSVGSGTKFDHIQVSYSGDDSFEWFGGAVNATHLVAHATWDDDFDTDNGFSGNLQFLFGVRDPKTADKSSSNGFESDNNATAADVAPYTSAVFANVTMVGPVTDPANFTDQGSTNGSSTGFFQNCIQIRRNSHLNLFNSVLMGYPIGLNIDNDKSSTTQTAALNGDLVISGNIMAGMVRNFQDKATNKPNPIVAATSDAVMTSIWNKEGWNNMTPFATIADLKLQGNPQSLTAPNAIPQSASSIATGAVWSNAKVSGTFFTKTAYRGAFSPSETLSANWMSGWTNFDPQNTVY